VLSATLGLSEKLSLDSHTSSVFLEPILLSVHSFCYDDLHIRILKKLAEVTL
jgi:hypothetical protein